MREPGAVALRHTLSQPNAVPGSTPSAGATPSPAGDAVASAPTRSGRPSPAPTPAPAPGLLHPTKQVLAAETVLLHAPANAVPAAVRAGAALAKAIRGTGREPGRRIRGHGSGGNTTGPGGSGHSSAPASAAQLAADQATTDADAAQLTVAQQNLDNAIVRSPISGTVVSVEVSPGTAVTAGSTAFEIAGLDSTRCRPRSR